MYPRTALRTVNSAPTALANQNITRARYTMHYAGVQGEPGCCRLRWTTLDLDYIFCFMQGCSV